MPLLKRRVDFFTSEEGAEVEQQLRSIAADAAYNTGPSYCANTNLYPNNLIPFVDKHMNYLHSHSAIDPKQYLANLRLMTRKK